MPGLRPFSCYLVMVTCSLGGGGLSGLFVEAVLPCLLTSGTCNPLMRLSDRVMGFLALVENVNNDDFLLVECNKLLWGMACIWMLLQLLWFLASGFRCFFELQLGSLFRPFHASRARPLSDLGLELVGRTSAKIKLVGMTCSVTFNRQN